MIEGVAVEEGTLLWTPSKERVAKSSMTKLMAMIEKKRGIAFGGDYETFRRWSVDQLEDFWADCWEFFDVRSDTPYSQVVDGMSMPGAKWFTGSRVNYAEHLLRHGGEDDPAVVHLSEIRPAATASRGKLRADVRIAASHLRAMGIVPGDRVVSYMPNIYETAVAFLATVAVGAVWSSAAPEFGVQTVLDRFSQIDPKLIFACDGYVFGGKTFDRRQEVAQIVRALPAIGQVVWLSNLGLACEMQEKPVMPWTEFLSGRDPGEGGFTFERVGETHPLWVVYSSGTTGLPKPIVPSHIGTLLEGLVLLQLHHDLGPGKRMFFYASTGWIMWNLTLAGLSTGASIVLYDGHPSHPEPDQLWKMTSEQQITLFGASPTFVQIMEKAGLKPGERFDLSHLDTILVSGSPATPETFAWFYRDVKADLWVSSASGGTDIAGGFVGGCPLTPVHAGEIQCRVLGHDVQAWTDDGRPVIDEVGELVCAKPLPSMPILFWNDADGARYRESYFEYFPGVWRHGDFLKINARGGCYIYGRSDSTLNRFGVRIGTAEIYRVVEKVEGVADSLVVCCELDHGKYFMPMFIKVKDGVTFDHSLRHRIEDALRVSCSPRHVPDKIYGVEAIPYTLTGKKMEVPVRKILMGWPLAKAANRDAMANPAALDYFIHFAANSLDYQRPTEHIPG